jgi:hypothetical protein
MEKPKETRMVLMEWGKSDFENYRENVLIRKYWKLWMIPMVVAFAILIYAGNIENNSLGIIAIGLMVVWCIAIVVLQLGLGIGKDKKYWNSIKDQEQPIKLARLPNWWRNKKDK